MSLNIPEIKTLLIYKEGEEKKKILLDYLDEDVLESYEILNTIEDNCPFEYDWHENSINVDYSKIEIFDNNDKSIFAKPVRVIEVEMLPVLYFGGKIFKLEEI